MADFNKAIPSVLKWEGGFADFKEDPGGATNRGITIGLFKVWAQSLGLTPTVEALKSLTEDQAKKIYKGQFWDKMQGDKFESQSLANIVFDGFVNMGNNGIRVLQGVLSLPIDGILGPATLKATNDANANIIFGLYKSARIKYYNDLVARKPEMKIFLNGWLKRVNSYQFTE